MISKNVDLIAIAVLLVGIFVYSTARRTNWVEVIPMHRIAFTNKVCRALVYTRQFSPLRILKD